MTYQEFVDKYNNKGIDFDGYYGFQCVDLADQYASEVVGHPLPGVAGAKDFWNLDIPGYDKIANTPDGVPLKGDIIIWGTGVGQYGHIAIFDHGDQNTFTSFDQNWPVNSLCHYQSHNYNGVLGWFHPKSVTIPQDTAQPNIITINDQTVINLGPYGKLEVQAIKGKMGDLERVQAQLADAQSINNQQAQIIADLRTQLANAPTTSKTPDISAPTVPADVLPNSPQLANPSSPLNWLWRKLLGK